MLSISLHASVPTTKAFIVGCGISLVVLGCGEVKSNGETDASSQVADASVSDANVNDASVEPADAGPDAGPTCPLGAICEANVNYAFVTSTQRPANEYGGLSGADAICNDLAQAAGLPGQYVAWMSSSTEDARDRLTTASGWIRTDGRPFALSRGGLIGGQIIHPLNLDESGVTRNGDVATATTTDGRSRATGDAESACEDWSGGGGPYDLGRSSETSSLWTDYDEGNCSNDAHLYCLGISNDNAIQLSETSGQRRAWLSTGTLAGDIGRNVMDALCTNEGKILGVDSAVAFVATTTESAVDRLDLTGPTWVRPDHAALWMEANDIVAKPPMAAINVSNQGGILGSQLRIWAGAAAPTTLAVAEANCQDWTAVSGNGLVTRFFVLFDYFSPSQNLNCSTQNHFYCFEE